MLILKALLNNRWDGRIARCESEKELNKINENYEGFQHIDSMRKITEESSYFVYPKQQIKISSMNE